MDKKESNPVKQETSRKFNIEGELKELLQSKETCQSDVFSNIRHLGLDLQRLKSIDDSIILNLCVKAGLEVTESEKK